jgi:ActR/RegA family two-component response regulator
MIRKKVRAHFTGLMVANTMANGLMANRMVWEHIQQLLERLKWENGKTESV